MKQSIRSLILRTNGILLMMFGIFGLTEDLFSYYAGTWVLGDALLNNSLAIGLVEAHSLAIILAVVLVRIAAQVDTTMGHQVAIAVHVLLATVNIVFWKGFVEFNIVPLGIVATVFHFIFIIANGAALLMPLREAHTSA